MVPELTHSKMSVATMGGVKCLELVPSMLGLSGRFVVAGS